MAESSATCPRRCIAFYLRLLVSSHFGALPLGLKSGGKLETFREVQRVIVLVLSTEDTEEDEVFNL